MVLCSVVVAGRHARLSDACLTGGGRWYIVDIQYGADKNVHGWSGFWSGRSNPEPALNQRAISAVLTAIWPAYMLIPAQFNPA